MYSVHKSGFPLSFFPFLYKKNIFVAVNGTSNFILTKFVLENQVFETIKTIKRIYTFLKIH